MECSLKEVQPNTMTSSLIIHMGDLIQISYDLEVIEKKVRENLFGVDSPPREIMQGKGEEEDVPAFEENMNRFIDVISNRITGAIQLLKRL